MPRRAHLSIFACLILLSGAAWFPLDKLLTGSPARAGHAAAAQADMAVIHDFYDAVNAALRTGLSPNFTGVLADDVVAHLDPPGLPSIREGLVSHLKALGATFPGIQFLPRTLNDDGNGRVSVEVSVEGATTGAFLGLSLANESVAWGPVDVFRIAGGLIVEFRGGRVDAPLLQPIVDLPIEVPVSSLHSLALQRITVAPGPDFHAGSVLGSEALYVEDGQIAVEVVENVGNLMRQSGASPVASERNRRVMQPGERAVLIAGDMLLLPQGAKATLRGDGGAAAVILKVAVRVPSGPNGVAGPGATDLYIMAAAEATGATAPDLGPRPVLSLPGGLARLGLGRVTLAPGAALPVATAGAVLFVIEAGNVSATNEAGTVWSRRGEDGTILTATGATYGQGDGILFEPGATGEVLSVASQPLVMFVVTITPARS